MRLRTEPDRSRQNGDCIGGRGTSEGPVSWSRLDTLRNRLVLLIFAITAAAIGFVYLYVVPQLESSLTAEKLRRLERLGNDEAPRLAQALADGAPQAEVASLVRSLSQATESRVTLLAVRDDESGTAEPDFVIADSQGEVDRDPGQL